MQRCPSLVSCLATALWALALGLPAHAQEQTPHSTAQQVRTFPVQALRGKITFEPGKGTVQVNGQALRTAPGLRVFDAKNHLVMLHTLKGQTLTVNYLIEPNTGMLRTVWLLTKAEADKPRKGTQERNFEFASEQAGR